MPTMLLKINYHQYIIRSVLGDYPILTRPHLSVYRPGDSGVGVLSKALPSRLQILHSINPQCFLPPISYIPFLNLKLEQVATEYE